MTHLVNDNSNVISEPVITGAMQQAFYAEVRRKFLQQSAEHFRAKEFPLKNN